jgi:choline dehydrogenase-like flavoprotein
VSLDDLVIDASRELSAEFPYQQDVNAGNPIGVSWKQSSIRDGMRTDSNRAYISKFTRRANLTVLTNTHVTKILKTGTSNGVPVFRGVEFASNSTGEMFRLIPGHRHLMIATASRFQVRARKEIILAAGTFNTPQLLMLSGIGDPVELSKIGIEPLVDLPSVGKNLSDHVFLSNLFEIDPNVNDTFLDPAVIPAELAQWQQNRTGPLTDTGARQVAWLRLPDTDPIFKTYRDPTLGPRSAHYMFIFVVGTRLYSTSYS